MNQCVICEREFEYRLNVGKFCNGCHSFVLRKRILPTNIYPPMPDKLTPLQEEILTGTLLGDAHMRKINGGKITSNAFLSIKRKPADREYLQWQASFFDDFTGKEIHDSTYKSSKKDKITGEKIHYQYTAVKFSTRVSQAFNEIYEKWYINGKKIVPRDLKLTPLILCEWFCDDGSSQISKSENSIRMYLYTQGFRRNDVLFLCYLLEEYFSEKFSISATNVITGSNSASRLYFKEIDKILPPGMDRKAKWRHPNIKLYDEVKRSYSKQLREFEIKFLSFIEKTDEFTCYDMAVETGCFYIHNGEEEPKYNFLNKFFQPLIENESITRVFTQKDKDNCMYIITKKGKVYFKGLKQMLEATPHLRSNYPFIK